MYKQTKVGKIRAGWQQLALCGLAMKILIVSTETTSIRLHFTSIRQIFKFMNTEYSDVESA